MNESDHNDLRNAFGQFVTGVTVVTTSGADRVPIGVTANSFGSVSLQPPMVLWSLAHSARSRATFEKAEYFCVHILMASQRELSERFACAGAQKFGDVKWRWGRHSLPLLREYLARFVCKACDRHAVGDHTVIIGEVLEYDIRSGRPLVFHGGQYAMSERRMTQEVARQLDAGRPATVDRRRKG